MKIEIGESLIYSLLRHEKKCQIVQTNWKASTQWCLQHESELNDYMDRAKKHFEDKYGCEVFKKTTSLEQLLKQAESDAIGIRFDEGSLKVFAVEVAFHESGVNYGNEKDVFGDYPWNDC